MPTKSCSPTTKAEAMRVGRAWLRRYLTTGIQSEYVMKGHAN